MRVQTIVSASLVLAFGGTARADDAPDPPPAPAGQAVSPAPLPVPPPVPTRPLGRFSLGVAYSSYEKWIFKASIVQPNLFGTGNLLSLDAQVSAVQSRFAMHYDNPYFLDSEYKLGVTVFSDHHELPGFSREGAGTALIFSRAISAHAHGFFGYQLERVTATADDPTSTAAATATARVESSGIASPQLRDGTIASLRAGLTYDTRDSAILARSGTSIGTTVDVADRILGSDFELARVTTWANTHQAIGPVILHLGGSVSSVTSTDPRGVPLEERLFLSGYAVRGYTPNMLGPVNALGTPVGGNFEAIGSAELEVPLTHYLSTTVFYDAAGIYDRTGIGQIGQSVGGGLIWRSPFGPLRIGVAFPLNHAPPGLYFGLGGGF